MKNTDTQTNTTEYITTATFVGGNNTIIQRLDGSNLLRFMQDSLAVCVDFHSYIKRVFTVH